MKKLTNTVQLVKFFESAEAALKEDSNEANLRYPHQVYQCIQAISESDWLDFDYQYGRELTKLRNADYLAQMT